MTPQPAGIILALGAGSLEIGLAAVDTLILRGYDKEPSSQMDGRRLDHEAEEATS